MFNYLTLIIFLPVVGAIIIALARNLSPKLIRYLAAIFTLIPLVLAVILFAQFDKSLAAAGTMQFVEKISWIPALNAFYHLGVDGLSLPLVLLTAFLGFIVVLISWNIDLLVREYFVWLLLL